MTETLFSNIHVGRDSNLGQTTCRRAWCLGHLYMVYILSKLSPYFCPGVKGKEKQAVGEIYELFESVSFRSRNIYSLFNRSYQIASELWPKNSGKIDDLGDSDTEDTGMSLEDQVVKEISSMKRPRTEDREQRFGEYTLWELTFR